MKKPVFLLFLLPFLVGAQLKVEWKIEFPVDETNISGLVVYNKNIYVTQTGGASVFNVLDPQGTLTFTSLANNTRIRSLFMYDDYLFSIGDQHLTKRELNGKIISEKLLIREGNSYISSRNGKILNGKAYTTHIYSDFLKYNLEGVQEFKKEIENLCENLYLEIGGNLVYIFSNRSNGSRLMQYDTLGNQIWSLAMGMVTNILADNDGNCYVFSVQPQTSSIVSKYNSKGVQIWSKVVTGQVVLNGSLHGDSLFVCGSECIDVAPNRHQNPTFSVLSVKDGAILHQQTLDFYEGDQGYGEGFSQLVYDGKALYLGGHSGSQYVENFLVKLSREGNTTGLPDYNGSRSTFSIFPNPGGSKFTIRCAEAGAGTLKVTVRNTLGQVVQSKEISCKGEKSWELDLGKQAAGNYNVEIVAGNQKIVKKIVIQ